MSAFDERVRFYLRHSARIEEWAALRKEAAQAIDEWLKKLAPDFEQLAAGLGAEVRAHPMIQPDSDFPGFRLLLPEWPENNERPGACIALEWSRKSTVMRDDDVPYVGVKCLKLDPMWSALRESSAFEAVRSRRKDKPGQYWAAWGSVVPKVEFLGAEDAYRTQILAAVGDAWRDYASLIEAARAQLKVTP